MSKWFTAYGVMTLVHAGKIDLDAPISTYLKRWRSLIHAHPPGSPWSFRSGALPAARWRTPAAVNLILELLVEDVSGLRFADYMERAVVAPLGMTRSTYAFLGDLSNTAASLTADGKPAPFQRYAASGATGLATSANDVLRFMQAQLHAEGAPLPRETVQRMRAAQASQLGVPIWGLGTILYAPTERGDFVFGHGGQNEPAINSEARLNPDSGDAILVLVTGNRSLATRLGFLWTFWQTGRPDVLALGAEIQRVTPWIGLGLLLLLLATGIGFWQTRPKAA